MALYQNFNKVNDYMKIGATKDSCYLCAKKLGANPDRDAYDTMRSLEGKVENKKVVVIRKSGIDACICMDCIKEIYDEHIAPDIIVEIPEDTTTTKEDKVNKTEEPVNATQNKSKAKNK